MSTKNKEFPFHRLPFLAANQIVRSYLLEDIFLLSLTSKKIQMFFKSHLTKNQVNLTIKSFDSTRFTLKEGSDRLKICGHNVGGDPGEDNDVVRLFGDHLEDVDNLSDEDEYEDGINEDNMRKDNVREVVREEEVLSEDLKNYTIGEEDLQIQLPDSSERVINVYWHDLQSGIQALITHFSRVYYAPQLTLILDDKFSYDQTVELLKHTEDLQLPIKKIAIKKSYLRPEATYRFNTDRNIGWRHNGSTVQRFQLTEEKWVPFAEFMQCQHVVVDDYRRIDLDGYFNDFFKDWIRLECRLEKMEITMIDKPGQFSEIVRGLSENQIEQVGNKQTLNVQKVDGRKATITYISKRNSWKMLLELDNDV